MKIIINGTLWVKKIDFSSDVISKQKKKKVGIQILVTALAKGQKKTAKQLLKP